MAKRKKKSNNLILGHYVVAFIDLLGQQEFLRNLSVLPNSNDPLELEKVKNDLKNTYGAVSGMRKFFKDSFDGFSRKPNELSGLTLQQTREFNSLNNHPIKFQSFSDSVVIFMPLRTDTAKLPVRGIWGIFGAAATTFLCCLAIGHPIRGGIDVGIGMDITKNEIYGPALSRAYTLESRISNYPRIVVGNELVRYLETLRDQTPHDLASEVAKYMSRQCLECLATDDDGYPIIDYLGKSYRDLFGEVIDATVVEKAHHNVLNFCAKFQNEKNGKLAFRYTLLRNYFEDRLHLWEELFSTKEKECNNINT